MDKCPICGKELESEEYNGDNWLEELYEKCFSGHYNYEYVYGYATLRIGNEIFRYDYNMTFYQIQNIMLDVSKEIEREKCHLAKSS